MKGKLRYLFFVMLLVMSMSIGMSLMVFAHDLTVTKSDGSPATENTDYVWDGNKLDIKTGGLVISGTTESEAINFYESNNSVYDITFDGLQISTSDDSLGEVVRIYSGGNDVSIHIKGDCRITRNDNYDYDDIGILLTNTNNAEIIGDTKNDKLTVTGGYNQIAVNGTSLILSGNLNLKTTVPYTADAGISVKSMTIKDNVRLESYAGNGEAIDVAVGSLYICDNASVHAKSDGNSSCVGVNDSVFISSSGTVVFEKMSNSGLGIWDGTLNVSNEAGKVILRGYKDSRYGALETYNSNQGEIGEDILVYGSTNINALESEITEEVEYKEVPGSGGTFTYYVGDQMAKALLFKTKNANPNPKKQSKSNYMEYLLKQLKADNGKKETPAKEIIDRDTFKSEADSKTVIVADSIGADSFLDMKVHAADEKTIANQKLLVQSLVGSNANVLLTQNIYPRRDLGMAEDGAAKVLIWNNLPKEQAGPVFAVVYNETDGAYEINGVLNANGTAVFNGFKLRAASTITICK